MTSLLFSSIKSIAAFPSLPDRTFYTPLAEPVDGDNSYFPIEGMALPSAQKVYQHSNTAGVVHDVLAQGQAHQTGMYPAYGAKGNREGDDEQKDRMGLQKSPHVCLFLIYGFRRASCVLYVLSI